MWTLINCFRKPHLFSQEVSIMKCKVFFCVAVCWLAISGFGDNQKTASAQELSENDIRQRQNFIEERLDDGRQHASYWQNGWTGFYAVSAAAQTVMWLDADNNDDRISAVVGAAKSAGALIDILLRPLPGRHGADEIRNLPAAERLSRGEELLDQAAQRAQERTSWKSHLKVIGVNLFSGILIAAFGDEGDAAVSTALGIAIGEANIWSQPSFPIENRKDYQRRFPESQAKVKNQWQLIPIANGAMLQITF